MKSMTPSKSKTRQEPKSKLPVLTGRMLVACAIFSIATGGASAQVAPQTEQSPDEKVYELSIFEVTSKEDHGYFKKNTMAGTRSAELLSNIPQSIQIITSELMRDIPTDNTVDVLKYGSSGINKRTVTLGDMCMRGFRVRTFLRDNVSFAGNINVPLYDIDRIEVVKGPAALVFGQSSATGGLINYVTKTPTKTHESSVKATIGSYDLYRVEANTSGPLGNTGLGYRGTFATTDGKGPRKFDLNKDLFLGTTLVYKLPGTASSIQFDYSFTKKDEIAGFTGVDSTGKLMQLGDDFTIFEPWVSRLSWYQFANFTYKVAITPSFHLQVVANYNQQNNDWDRVTPIGRPDPVTGLLKRNFQELFFADWAVNQLTDFLHSFNTGSFDHKFSYGWAIATSKSGPSPVTTLRISDLNVFNPAYNTPKPNFTRSPGSFGNALIGSAYIQEQVSFLNGKAIVVGGARYNRFHSTSLSNTNKLTTERNDQKTVLRYGAVFKPMDWASVYYNYSESFVFNTGLIQGGPRDGQQLLPSVGENKEVGIKIETADGRLFATLAYFDLSLTNVRVLITLPPGSVDRFGNPIPGNLGILQEGKETNKGAFEADIGLSLNSPLGPLQAILTLYRGDSRNAAGVLPNSVVNDIWSVFVAQEFNKERFKGLRIGAGAYYKGSTTGVGPAPGTPTAYTQAGYTTTVGFLSYGTGKFRFALNVDNIFDKKDFIEGGESDFWLFVNPGRTFKFSVNYHF